MSEMTICPMSLIDTCCCDLLVRLRISPTDEDSPTDEEARATCIGDDFFERIEARMPSGNFSVQPSASVFDSRGSHSLASYDFYLFN